MRETNLKRNRGEPPQEHRWLSIRLGRVCERFGTTQATGEFDDAAPCERASG
jgi:hypothetical protein